MPMLTTVRMRRPVEPVHDPSRTRSANAASAVEHLVDVGHDVVAVDLDHCVGRRAQRHVQHGAVAR